jgi:23S rRNA (uracil1939-C5)-methyltransferase
MERNQELRLSIEGVANDGRAVARVDRYVVFVDGGVRGDLLDVRIRRRRRRFAEAEILSIVQPGPERTTPRCSHFGVCGGCQWQHIDYQAQLELKRHHVAEAMERIGGLEAPPVQSVLGMADPYYYRNKMEFSFGDRWMERAELDLMGDQEPATGARFALGLHIPQRFDKVLDVEECYLQSPQSTRIVQAVRSFARQRGLSIYSTVSHRGYLRNLVIRQSRQTAELMVNIVTSEDRSQVMGELSQMLLREVPEITTICNNITTRKSQVALGDEERVLYGPGFITERLGGRLFRISANSFFQTNTLQTELLYEEVRRSAQITPADIVYDLYSGTGTIAIVLAADARSVVAVESSVAAVEDALRNTSLNGVTNCTFVAGDLKEKLTVETAWMARHGHPDVVVLDPPRAGVHPKVLTELERIGPRRIVYVSCNPATQARDLKLLCAQGSYRIELLQPFDMFPHTRHVENVATLQKT